MCMHAQTRSMAGPTSFPKPWVLGMRYVIILVDRKLSDLGRYQRKENKIYKSNSECSLTESQVSSRLQERSSAVLSSSKQIIFPV